MKKLLTIICLALVGIPASAFFGEDSAASDTTVRQEAYNRQITLTPPLGVKVIADEGLRIRFEGLEEMVGANKGKKRVKRLLRQFGYKYEGLIGNSSNIELKFRNDVHKIRLLDLVKSGFYEQSIQLKKRQYAVRIAIKEEMQPIKIDNKVGVKAGFIDSPVYLMEIDIRRVD